MEIVAQRAFGPLYIRPDTAFLVVFALLLFFSRRPAPAETKEDNL